MAQNIFEVQMSNENGHFIIYFLIILILYIGSTMFLIIKNEYIAYNLASELDLLIVQNKSLQLEKINFLQYVCGYKNSDFKATCTQGIHKINSYIIQCT